MRGKDKNSNIPSTVEMTRAANGLDFGRAAEVEPAGRSQYF